VVSQAGSVLRGPMRPLAGVGAATGAGLHSRAQAAHPGGRRLCLRDGAVLRLPAKTSGHSLLQRGAGGGQEKQKEKEKEKEGRGEVEGGKEVVQSVDGEGRRGAGTGEGRGTEGERKGS